MTGRMVVAAGPNILLSYGISRGLDVDELCAAIGCAPHQLTDPSQMVPFETSLRLWRLLIARLPNENIGVGVALFARPEHYGSFFNFVKYLANGVELLQLHAQYAAFTDTACIGEPVTCVEDGDTVELRWPASLKYGIPERTEGLNVTLLRLLRELSGVPVRPRLVRAANPVDDKRRMAAEHYGCPVQWDAEDDALCFDREVLRTPFVGAQPEAAEALRRFVDQKLLLDARLRLGERVRRVIETQIGAGSASQEAVARALGMSTRSLQRGLRDEGLRYGDVLGEALKRAGTRLMGDRRRSLDDVAVALGYSETSSFARAWRRLTGEPPARYRARLLREAHEQARPVALG